MIKQMQKGSFTIEASVYVSMIMMIMMITIRSGIAFYQESVNREEYGGLKRINVVSEFYIYKMIEEIGEEWEDD